MAKNKKIQLDIDTTEETKPVEEEIEVIFIKNFEGNLNNYSIKAKAGDKRIVNKIVYDFIKSFGVIEQ